MNAFELAERADVSASTVYRLCRKLGFDGFSPFRTALAASFRDTMFQDVDIDFNIPFGKEDDTGTVVRKMGALYKYSVDKTIGSLDLSALEAVADRIRTASRVFVLTTSFNVSAAQTFHMRLREIGIHIHVVTEPDQQKLTCSLARTDDLFLFLTYNGKMDHIVDCIRTVYERGTQAVLITSVLDNPCRYYASMELLLCSEEDALYKIGTFSSYISAQFLLDILFCMLYQDEYQKNLLERKTKYMVK